MLLQNKVAFVTGGTSGIGKAIVERFVNEGAAVMAASKSGRKVKISGNVEFIRADVSREKDVQSAFRATKNAFGKIDIVVNNAGVWGWQELRELSEKELDRIFGVNTKGVLWGMKHAFNYLKRPKARTKIGGKTAILNIRPIPG